MDLKEKLYGKAVSFTEKLAVANSTTSVKTDNPKFSYTRPDAPEPIKFGLKEDPEDEIKPTLSESFSLKDREVSFSKDDVENVLKPMLYSEISPYGNNEGQRPKEKVELEMRTIANTVMNRANNRKQSVNDVVFDKNQYQGVDGPKFKNFSSTSDPLEKEQIDFINETMDKMLSEIEQGTFNDNVGGAEFYGHLKDGTIRAFDTWEQYKEAINKGLVK